MFEKYKKHFLLALTFFALLTFSITGAVYGFFGRLFSTYNAPKITMESGQTVDVTLEDIQIGRLLNRLAGLTDYVNNSRLPVVGLAMPHFLFPVADIYDESPELVFAILRRAAIENGIEVSETELDKAVEYAYNAPLSMFERGKKRITEDQAAASLRLDHVRSLRILFREAMRISTFVRLEMAGSVDLSDRAFADWLSKKRKRLEVSLASFSASSYRKALELSPPKDEELVSWIEGLDAADKTALVDPLRVTFEAVGMLYEDADPADFEAETAEAVIGDTEIQSRYEADKDALYRKDPPKKPDAPKDGKKPEAPKDGKAPAAAKDGKKAGNDKKSKNDKTPDENGGLLQTGEAGAKKAEAGAKKTGAKKTGEATAPDQKSATDADAAQGINKDGTEQTAPSVEYIPLDDVKDEIRKKLLLEVAVSSLLADAKQAAEDHRSTQQLVFIDSPSPFDLKAWFDSVSKKRDGLVYVPERKKPVRPDSYKDMGALGDWLSNWKLESVSVEGDFGPDVEKSSKGAFFFRVGKREENQVKPLASIKKEALDLYYEKKGLENAKKDAEAFVKLVREQAKVIKKKEVAEHEKKIDERTQKRFDTWKAEKEARLARVKRMLADPKRPARALAAFKAQKIQVESELAAAKEEQKSIRERVAKQLEEELDKLLEPAMAEAFGKALAIKKLEAKKLAPFFIDESSYGRFSTREKSAEKFIKENRDLLAKKEGFVSDLLDDSENKAFYVARLDKVSEGGAAALSRRAWQSMREGFNSDRVMNVLSNGFDLRALKKRYKYTETRAEEAKQDEKKPKQ